MKKKLLMLPLILGGAMGILLVLGWLGGGELIYTLVILGVPAYIIYRTVRGRKKHVSTPKSR